MNLDSNKDIIVLDTEVEELDSITHFLQLPIMILRTNNYKRNLMVDFAKSITLILSTNKEATIKVINARENARRKKKR